MAKKRKKLKGSREETEDKTGYNPAYSLQRGDVPKGKKGQSTEQKLGRKSKRIPSGQMVKLRDPQKINNPKVQGKARAKMLTDRKGGRTEYEDAVYDSALVNKFGPARKYVKTVIKPKRKPKRGGNSVTTKSYSKAKKGK